MKIRILAAILGGVALISACSTKEEGDFAPLPPKEEPLELSAKPKGDFLNAPIITELYTGDPSAHVFNDKIYIYPSHDIASDKKPNAQGDHFAMTDIHVFSMEKIKGKVRNHGIVLDIKNIPWAEKQLWAPDAAEKDGKYYLYFSAKNKQGFFQIGVAVADKPEGPFKAEPQPIADIYSIDPAVFKDTDGAYYLYFGGIGEGQLQKFNNGKFTGKDNYPPDKAPSIRPKVAKLAADMKSLAESARDVFILDDKGGLIITGDHERRFYRGTWMHKYKDKYYLSYSTGDTRNIVYGTGPSALGPFTYAGKLLEPPKGATAQHSIISFKGKWYAFYHDTELSKGQDNLRSVKVTELVYKSDDKFRTIDTFLKD